MNDSILLNFRKEFDNVSIEGFYKNCNIMVIKGKELLVKWNAASSS